VKPAVVVMVFLVGVSACAQDVPDAPSQSQGAAQPYGGPSLLSRGDDPSVLRGVDLPPLYPYLGVTGVYLSDKGYYGNPTATPFGFSGMFGITGIHTWSHTELDVDYHGSYRDYVPNRQQDGLDNSLNLSLKHQLTPHLSLSVTENLARARNFAALPIGTIYGGGTSGFYPLYSALSGTDLSSAPTLASVGGVRMTYQMSARLSVSAGGTGIISRQQLPGGTIGSDGYVASADIAYRLTRYQTISAGYSFIHFGYAGRYGQTDIHGLNLDYALRVGRNWELSASAGVSRSETLGEVLDPVLAQLLGVSAVLVKTYSVSYMPSASARLTRSFHHSSWSATYDRTVMGAASLYGNSTYEDVSSIYTNSALRRLNLNVGAGYYRLLPSAQSLGGYHSLGISGGFGVPMGRGFSWVGRIDERQYVFASSHRRTVCYATLGIAWRPGRVPVSLW